MKRDGAVANLRAGLSALHNAEVREIAFAAFDISVHEPSFPRI